MRSLRYYGGASLLMAGMLLEWRTLRVPVHAESKTVTWREQVAPLVFRRCTGCHHAGGSGPFDLTIYAGAHRWGPQIADVVQSRYMPPWLPESTGGPHPVRFQGDRHLQPAEIELITAWVKAGMPEGSGAEPHAPAYSTDWQMGTPDLVLEMAEAVTEPASGADTFVNFVLPAGVTQTRWIRAMEIQPGAGSLVHHANVILDRTEAFRSAHPESWRTGVPGMDLQIEGGDTFDPDSHFLFWKPDSTALVEPAGMPWRLDPGNDLILNMHLKPTGKPEQIRARIGLYFSKTPATAQPMLLELEHDAALDIPANDANFVVTDALRLPVAVDLLGVYPHAHYLGHEMEAWATLPDGRKQPILLIRNWDIDRQAVYELKESLALPAGTVVHMRYTYDNSAANVHNPSSPPVRVAAGNRATDEMGHLWLQVLPHADGASDPRYALEQVWMENMLRKSPGDPLALYNLGALREMAGDPQQAIAYYKWLLQEQPQNARALTALGAALQGTGDFEGARAQFVSALKVNPENTDAAYDLGVLLLQTGQSAGAEQNFRQVLRGRPMDAPAARGLAQALLDQSRTQEAIHVVKVLLERDRDDAEAHRLLALAYTAEGDEAGTVAELREWARLTPGQPEAHRALAQVFSAAGHSDQAIAEQHLVLQASANNAGDWNDLGAFEARAGHIDKARLAFQNALRLDPGNVPARKNLASLDPTPGTR